MQNNLQTYDDMSIYDLRNYARSIGVISPTKLKRADLIEKINAIINGGTPEKKKTNKGRPPKHKPDETFILNNIFPNKMFGSDDDRFKIYSNGANFENFAGDVLSDNKNMQTTNILFDGYFEKTNTMYGFVMKRAYLSNYNRENIVVLDELTSKFHLKDGDYVVGACKYMPAKDIMIATDIVSINGRKADEIKNFDDQQPLAIYPNCPIKLSFDDCIVDLKIIDKVCPIAKGSRAVIESEKKLPLKFYQKLLNSLAQNGISTMLVSIDDPIEEINDIIQNCPDVDVVAYSLNSTREQFINSLGLRVKNYFSRMKNGGDYAIVYYNASNLISNFKINQMVTFQKQDSEASAIAINEMKDILSLSMNTKSGSLSSICFNCGIQEIDNMATTFIKFNAFAHSGSDVFLNFDLSHTINLDKMLPLAEVEKIEKFKQNANEQNLFAELEKLF